jgi:hypothetical protein
VFDIDCGYARRACQVGVYVGGRVLLQLSQGAVGESCHSVAQFARCESCHSVTQFARCAEE